jgi:hypothetical protein
VKKSNTEKLSAIMRFIKRKEKELTSRILLLNLGLRID